MLMTVTKKKPAATPPPVSQRTLAYEGFRRQILSATIRPGQFVSQRELMRLLDLPLGAIREMIPRLEAARLIVTVPKRGLQIAPVDLKLIRNAFQVRSMVEREAVRHFLRSASDEELTRIERQHMAILERASSIQPDPSLDSDAQTVDWGLHDMMVDSIGNEILSEIYRVNSLHVRLIRLDAGLVRPMRVVPAMEEHQGHPLHQRAHRSLQGACARCDARLEPIGFGGGIRLELEPSGLTNPSVQCGNVSAV
jgi:DNA-binding GntR family transcriptional regulator